MKRRILMILYLVPCLWMDVQRQPESLSPLTGPYLGQKPPGSDPEIFAPGIISRPGYFEHSAALFSPDGKEVYRTAKAKDQRDYRIYSMKMINGIWPGPMWPASAGKESITRNVFCPLTGREAMLPLVSLPVCFS